MTPSTENVKWCRPGLHPKPHRGECLVCKRSRDDRHRLNARLAGKDALRQREWLRAKYQSDPEYRARKNAANLAGHRRPEAMLAVRLGVSVEVARTMLKAGR
jgi:hypothetical protein